MFKYSHALLLAATATQTAAGPLPLPDRGGVPDSKLYDYGVMGPPATPAIVAAAQADITLPAVAGPFEPTWESIQRHYRTPSWFEGAKFGIFMHWGVYAVPAYHNEWYEKHMYAADRAWHSANFGSQERFGYKDFIPLFKQEKFDPAQWAALFKRAGARLVMPSAQHHDNYAMWDSAVAPLNAKRTGPMRDLIGELAVEVRRHGMKLALSNHGIENFTFINPDAALDASLRESKADLYDPAWAAFYNVADRSDAAMSRFLGDWVHRNVELIDRYRPDLLWFDNGVNLRVLDPLKLQVAAYYYNRAREWGKEVSLSTKYIAYAPSNDDTRQIGSIIDFEKIGVRSPGATRPGPWMVDDTIGSTWGYTRGMSVAGGADIVARLVDTVAKGGFYMLNLSPMADGSIPDAQQRTLLEIGDWLVVNGEAIYDTHPRMAAGAAGWHFTLKGDVLYAIGKVSGGVAFIEGLHAGQGKGLQVAQLGQAGKLTWKQDALGVRILDGAESGGKFPVVFKITGARQF